MGAELEAAVRLVAQYFDLADEPVAALQVDVDALAVELEMPVAEVADSLVASIHWQQMPEHAGLRAMVKRLLLRLGEPAGCQG